MSTPPAPSRSSSQGQALDTLEAALPGLLSRCERPAHGLTPDLLDVPHAYHAPCHSGPFQMQFYWDTYFVNRVLLGLGRMAEARAGIENLVDLLGTYGHVPNCNHRAFVKRSQPPMLALMVHDLHRAEPDRDWLRTIVPALVAEHAFWTDRRAFPSGLCHYGHSAGRGELVAFSRVLTKRLGMRFGEEEARVRAAGHHLAEAESGWDFTPRFLGRCLDFAPVDLNCLLYRSECIIADFASELGCGDMCRAFREAAVKRRRLINDLLWCDVQGLYADWDTAGQRHSPVASLATFFPLWCGVAPRAHAARVVRRLGLFEHRHGLTACAPGPRARVYQWDYPNGWAPLHLIAVEGMQAYGHCADACRVAGAFLGLVARCHAASGELWEKYNVVSGALDVGDEYPMPPLVGWTAAAVVALRPLLEQPAGVRYPVLPLWTTAPSIATRPPLRANSGARG